jgi:hypothetical protein
MKRALLLVAFSCLAVVNSAMAAGPKHPNGGTNNAADCSPGANKMVLNIVFQVTNDADSAVGGNYWAIDNYTKHIQVFDQGVTNNVHTFCVVAKYDGSFLTASGPSPEGTGTVGAGVTGTFQGGYSGTITGNFIPGTKRAKGSAGSKDFGCAINDSGTAVGCNYYDWIGDYFPGSSFTYTSWGWTYEAGNNGTWINASTGNSGDINGTVGN